MEHCHTMVENSQKSMEFSNLELITLSMVKKKQSTTEQQQ